MQVTLRRAVDFYTPMATTIADASGKLHVHRRGPGERTERLPSGLAQSPAGNTSRLDRTFTTTALDTTAPAIVACWPATRGGKGWME